MKVSEKKQIVSELAKESRINKEQADFIYDVLMDILARKIQTGNGVYLRGIGRITTIKSRGFRSNLTGVSIPNHKRIIFIPNRPLARKIRVETREHPIKS